MNAEEIRELLPYLTGAERNELNALLAQIEVPVWQALEGPQRMAFDSEADIVGYGGAAGGGKTDLAAGLAMTKHKRVLICRREKAQTEGVIQRIGEIVGSTSGYSSQHSRWQLPIGSQALLEFGGLDNPGDERRWQGRPHDLKVFDECTEQREAQVRFVMGWMRSNDPTVKCKVLMTFNPPTTAEGRWVISYFAPWLDKKHPNRAMPGELRWFTTIAGKDIEVPDSRPFVMDKGERLYNFDELLYTAEQVIKPMSRTFIPARLTDNPYYMATGYMSTLQALPEPLRSQMLNGDFSAGIEDDAFQLIPTEWVEQAQARWVDLSPKPPMDSLGIDVARGGKDSTVISRRHGMWYDKLLKYPGSATPDGPSVAGLSIAAKRDGAPMHIDVIGVGASPYDFLNSNNQHVLGINVSEKALSTDLSGRLRFSNQRSQYWWQLREDLDPANNTGIALPPDQELLADLTAPKWKVKGNVIQVESREEIYSRIGRSPDSASAVILARIDTPKAGHIRMLGSHGRHMSEDHGIQRHTMGGHDPYANNLT
jgi:hypothetical protein